MWRSKLSHIQVAKKSVSSKCIRVAATTQSQIYNASNRDSIRTVIIMLNGLSNARRHDIKPNDYNGKYYTETYLQACTCT